MPGPKSERPGCRHRLLRLKWRNWIRSAASLQNLADRIQYFEARVPNFTLSQAPVPELCQNPIHLVCRELLFERKQLPQIVDNRHFRMELMESLETANILRNQQVAGSIPAGGSIFQSLTFGFVSIVTLVSHFCQQTKCFCDILKISR